MPSTQPVETLNSVPTESLPSTEEKEISEPSPENAIKEEKTPISTAESVAPADNNPVLQNYSYNLPSTFIDMESIYSEVASTSENIQKSLNLVSSQQYLPTNVVYPGSIAQYYAGTNDLMANNYSSFDPKQSLFPPGKICKIPATTTNNSQSYPWPMPNLNENGSSFTNQ